MPVGGLRGLLSSRTAPCFPRDHADTVAVGPRSASPILWGGLAAARDTVKRHPGVKTPVSEHPPERAPSLLFHAVVITLVLLPLVGLFLRPAIVGGIEGSDIDLEFRANRAYGFGELGQGRIPHWNPYQFCGYPFVASLQSAIFYPLNLVFLLLDVDSAFVLSAFLHLALAGVFGYAIAWRMTESSEAAAMASIIATYNLGILNRVYAGHVTMTSGYPWLVLGVGSFWLAAHELRFNRYAYLTAVALAMSVLAGHPSMPFLIGVAIVVTVLTVSWQRRTIPAATRVAGRAIGVCLLGVALAAVQLVPTLVYLTTSARSGGVGFEFATSSSFPPEAFGLFLAPHFMGDNVAWPYFGRWFLWELMPYVGLVPVGLLIATILSPQIPNRHLISLLAIAVLLSLGRHAFYYKFLLDWVPGFAMFRGPARQMHLFTVAIAFVAASCLKSLPGVSDSSLWRATKVLGVLFVGVMVCWLAVELEPNGWDSRPWRRTVALVVAQGDRYETPDLLDPFFFERTYQGARRGLRDAMVALALVTGLFGIASRAGPVSRRRLVVLVVLAFALLDLLWYGSRYVRPSPPSPVGLPPAIVAEVKKAVPVGTRIASKTSVEDLSLGAVDGIGHVGGMDPALPRRYTELIHTIRNLPAGEPLVISEPIRPGPLFRLLAASHVLARSDAPPYPGSEMVMDDGDYQLFALEDPLPRAFLATGFTVVPDRAERLKMLGDLSEAVDPRRVIVERPLALTDPPLGQHLGEASITEYEPLQVSIAVEATHPGLLVLSDTFDPQWRVEIDGVDADVVAVNHLFRGVVVPEGEHVVRFYYSTWPFRLGLVFCSLGWALVTLRIFRPKRTFSRRRESRA